MLGRDKQEPLFPPLDTFMGPIALFGKKVCINVFWNPSMGVELGAVGGVVVTLYQASTLAQGSSHMMQSSASF